MTSDTPRRLREYNGPITRGARWDSYRPRSGDIIISAPAKSGMTWMQAICAMLIFGRADLDIQPARISPWFDSNFEPLAEMLKRLDAQTHRRYLKTHTPLDGLPYYPQVTYLAVYRHPLDAFHSMASLGLKASAGSVRARAHMPTGGGKVRSRIRTPPDLRSFITACVETPFTEGVGEQLSVASIAQHLTSFWPWRELPNICLIHYADMRRDLVGSIRTIAAALGIALDDDTAAAIASSTSFESMQGRAQQFAPENGGGWKDARDFFGGGTGGRWKDVLSADDLAAYRRARNAALPDQAAAAWLESGNG